MATVPYGPEFMVSNGAFGAEVAVASDTDRFMLVWEGPDEPPEPDEEYNNEYNELYGRAYSVLNPLTGIFQVNTEMGDPQVDPAIIRYGDGSYIAAYRSGFNDSLEGTFIATQRFDVNGNKLGPEVYSPDYSNYHREPDAAVINDRRSVVVSTEEFDIEALVYDEDGAVVAAYNFGFAQGAATVTRHPTIDDRVVVVWQGYPTDDPEADDPFGLYWQELDVDDGTLTVPELIQELPEGFDADPSAVTMRLSDRVNIVYTVPDGGGGRDIMLYSRPFDGVSSAYFTLVNNGATAGDQLRPVIDDIDGERVVIAWEDRQVGADDASGSSIRATVIDSSVPAVDSPVFLVNQVTAGDQAGPSVAQVDEGIFVVAWTDGDGTKARLFDANGESEQSLNSYLITRLEGQDGSDFLNQRLRGFDVPQSYYFEIATETGDDLVLDFARNDVLLTNAPLFDSNGDGIINFASNRVRLDGKVAGSDTVQLDGIAGSALRYIGEDEGLSVYATASVRPTGAKEVLLGSAGVAGVAGADLFFYDAALDLPPDRSYTLTNFGATDVLVTTVAIADNNGDGKIGFGADKRVDIGASDFSLEKTGGGLVTSLEHDGSVVQGGVTYFVYSLVGSAVGTDALG